MSIHTTESSPGITSCSVCGKEFKKGEQFMRMEEKRGWFRGDDEVSGYCLPCWNKKKRGKE